jgi:hypothetical protein
VRKLGYCLLASALVLTLAGCGTNAGSADASVSAGSTAPEETVWQESDQTVYRCGDVEIALPTESLSQLLITTEFESSDDARDTPLLSLREKASVEATKADYGGDVTGGFLWGISCMTQVQYELYLSYDHSGLSVFAKGDDVYYAYCTATDVQFYREGGDYQDQAEWAKWEALMGLADDVRADFIARNGLSAYSDSAFTSREFTYDGAHAYLKFYPYYTFDGSTAQYDTLVLSQPAKQGAGGVWCVERWYDEYGTLYYWFPAESGMCAADYYAQAQSHCDSGSALDSEQALLTPVGAAEEFVKNSGYYSTAPVDASFAETDGIDDGYFDANTRICRYVASLLTGGVNEPNSVIQYVDLFTADTWGVLGRGEYGSDWWTVLNDTLKSVAVGGDQDGRDQSYLRLFLSYPKESGPIAEDLAALLRTQQEADPVIFSNVLSGFSDAEQSRVNTALSAK